MLDDKIKIDNLDYGTFAATLSQLGESDRMAAAFRVHQLIQSGKNRSSSKPGAHIDEEAAFRADIAVQVLRELARAGKIKRLIQPGD